MNKLLCHAWITLIITLLKFNTGTSEFLAKPEYTETIVGQTAFLNCSIRNQNGRWRKVASDVFFQGEIQKPYIDRFQLDNYTTNVSFNLIILNVTLEDAGSYSCYDEEIIARASSDSAELIVLERDGVYSSNMRPDGIFGPNDCYIEPEVLNLTCSVTYNGDIEPKLEWIKTGIRNETVETACKTHHREEGKSVICSATIKSTVQMNNSTYVCRTNSSTTHQHILCSSEVVKILYALTDQSATEAALNEEVICSQETSQLCTFTWRQFKETVSNNMSLTPGKPGLYTCEAQCDFRGKRCSVHSFAFVPNSTTAQGVPGPSSENTESDSKAYLTIPILAICLLVAVIVVLAYQNYIYRANYKKKCAAGEEANRLNDPDQAGLSEQADSGHVISSDIQDTVV